MISLIDIMAFKYPTKKWKCGDSLESLVWLDPVDPKPTRAELIVARDEYQAYKQANRYREQREQAYPTLQRQMIAIIEYLQQTVVAPSPELQRMFTKLDAVKLRYPKP